MPYVKLWPFRGGAHLVLYDEKGRWVMTVRSYVSHEVRKEMERKLTRAVIREMFPERFMQWN